MKISVVIVNYKVPYLLLQCVDAVYKSLNGISSEVFVVDNASNDNSQSLITKYFPSVLYIANHENVGFAKANNQAIKVAKGKYVLLLNPDTIIAEDTIKTILENADATSDFGALGVRMIDLKGSFLPESKRGIPSVWVSFCKLTLIHKFFPNSSFFNGYYYPQVEQNEMGEVPILAGACMLLHKQTLGDEALLDEQFFMYGEDIDLSYRIKLHGFKNLYVPTTIIHYKGESTKKGDMKYLKAFYQSMLLFYKKHHAGSFPLWFYPLSFIIQLYASLAYTLRIKKPAKRYAKQTMVFSTQEYTYKEIIEQVEKNGGQKYIQIYHPTFDITI